MTRKTTLRDIQKADTRQRLLDAASRVFDREGYDMATVDQISSEAGASRPTFYAHFRDKEEVLSELMDGYIAKGIPFMLRFPGEDPTPELLIKWLHEVGDFIKQESALFSLLSQMIGHRPPNSKNHSRSVGQAWLVSLASSSPAFARAISPDQPNLKARVKAELLLLELVWASASILSGENEALNEARVELVAQSIYDFLTTA